MSEAQIDFPRAMRELRAKLMLFLESGDPKSRIACSDDESVLEFCRELGESASKAEEARK